MNTVRSTSVPYHDPTPETPTLSVEAAYALAAECYDAWSWQSFWRENEFPLVRAMLADAIPAGEHPEERALLDIGCGTGWYMAHLADLFGHVAGVDISESMLDVARASYPAAEFRHAPADALPFADGAFDAAVCCRVMTHLESLDGVFAEAARVLRPAGAFVVSNIAVSERFGRTRLPVPGGGTVFASTFGHGIGEIGETAARHGFETRAAHALDMYGQRMPFDARSGWTDDAVSTLVAFVRR